MRTKLVLGGGSSKTDFNERLNIVLEELGSVKIIDIKFSFAAYPDMPSRNPCRYYSALILYESGDASS